MLSDTEFKGEGPAPSGSRPPLLIVMCKIFCLNLSVCHSPPSPTLPLSLFLSLSLSRSLSLQLQKIKRNSFSLCLYFCLSVYLCLSFSIKCTNQYHISIKLVTIKFMKPFLEPLILLTLFQFSYTTASKLTFNHGHIHRQLLF